MEVSSAYKQAMASHHPLEQVLTNPCISTHQHLQSRHEQQQQHHHHHHHHHQQQQQQEKKPKPHQEQALRCPRCDSTNTKFCYYNNYSLSQPRYFCKGCRRYWTQGGSLRNVPVGGGCRKNKKSSSCSTSSSSSKKPQAQITLLPPLPPPPPPQQPTLSYDNNDLTLGFAPFLLENPNPNTNPNPDSSHVSGFLDILRSGLLDNGTTPICFGFGGNVQDMVFPFEGGGLVGASATSSSSTSAATASTTTTTTVTNNNNNNEMNKLMNGDESKVLIGVPWHVGGDASLGLDNGKDCWNGVGSSWHGVINSSLI